MTPICAERFHLSFLNTTVFSKTVEIALKLSDCAISIFQAFQGAIIVLIPIRETPQGNHFCRFCNDALNFTNPDQFEMLAKLHGYFLLTSGVLGVAGALNDLGVISVYAGASLLNPASLSLFVVAKLFSLTYSSKLFAASFQKQHCTRLNQISKIHLLSSLNAAGYIIAAASSAFQGPILLTALSGGLALTVGGIKIIYEIFFYNPRCKFN